MAQDRHDEISALAHQIWEEEGRPEGKHEEHWRRAAEEVERRHSTDDNAGIASGLHPGGTLPAGGHSTVGSIGTGGGSTAGEGTGTRGKR